MGRKSMKPQKNKLAFNVILACVFFMLITPLPCDAAEINDSLAECSSIKDDVAERLKCFNELASKKSALKEDIIESPVEKKVVTPDKKSSPQKFIKENSAEINDSLAKCSSIKDDVDERLKCFNELLKKQPASEDDVKAITVEKKAVVVIPDEKTGFPEYTKTKSAEVETSLVKCTKLPDNNARLKCFDDLAKENPLSVMEKQWDMGPHKENNIFAIWPYRPFYILPFAYNFSPNEDAQLDIDPKAKAQSNEVKFQLSFKFKMWEDIFRNTDIWLAYTQLSFWQLYNSAFSAPFRDTNYEPEILFNYRMRYPIPGLTETKLQFINFVLWNHQSNGRSEPLSRSWNRTGANVGLETQNFLGLKNSIFGVLIKTWYRWPENEKDDDNPDISRYVGYGEIGLTLNWEKWRAALMLRNNLRSENNKGAGQFDLSIPIPSFCKFINLLIPLSCDQLKDFSIYVQYFNGYGESLLDYNTSVNRFSLGIMLMDWK
jgi:phospholipase A1